MQVGDVIKHKHLGTKKKFIVLGPHDTIQDGDVQHMVLDFAPMCYEYTLSMYKPTMRFHVVRYCNDTVSDEHTHRIYLRPII